ncbi:hypothetical protein [Coralliovum pocilloporae]|uniref:hypothetical protein n=1 Tax=Coralliovum pocilloporae TaxID=3066369 RepID=UPI00330746C3
MRITTLTASFSFLLTLAACSSGSLPTADISVGPTTAPAAAAPETFENRQNAAYVFEPLVGAPQEVGTQLSQRLASTAEQRGVKILPPTLGEPTHKIKGYLSAVNNGAGTLVNYTWDILTPDNQRVFRIRGEALGDQSSDPWSGVTSQTVADIASDTIDQIKQWQTRNPQP